MSRFAKIIDDQTVKYFEDARFLNKNGASFEAAALAAGYKPVVYESQPHSLTEPYWRETAQQVRHGWRDLDLDVARARVIAEIDAVKRQLIASTLIVEVDGKQFDFNAEASLNLLGAKPKGDEVIAWTLSDYSLVMLDAAGADALEAAFIAKKSEIYTWQHELIEQVKACEAVEELAAIMITYPEGGAA